MTCLNFKIRVRYYQINIVSYLLSFINSFDLLMAKKSMIEREKKRIRLEKKYSMKRKALLLEYQTASSFSSKIEIHSKLQQLPRNSAKTRIRNRCWKTGRPRGVFRDFGVSRHVFREMAHQCLLPGVTKSSW
jgi:small subunit ribosomal protein S14